MFVLNRWEAMTPGRQFWSSQTEEYHPDMFGVLTEVRDPDPGQCVVGSLTGAVSSQRVTEERKGILSTVGNRADSVKA